MIRLLRFVQAFLGSAIPLWLLWEVTRAFSRFLNTHLKEKSKAAYVSFLRDGGLNATSQTVADRAANALNRFFGPRHLSWQCFLTSAFVTVASIMTFVLITALLHVWVSSYFGEDGLKISAAYWLLNPAQQIKGAISWIIWSIAVDYISLYKTRKVIIYLQNHQSLSFLACLADFLLGFIIYIVGFCSLSALATFVGGGLVPPPAVSFETSFSFILLFVLWAKFFVSGSEQILISKGVDPAQISAFFKGDAGETLLGISFMVQLFPFFTIGSDFLYASMVPSIWLWIFLFGISAAKLINYAGSYMSFSLRNIKDSKQTIEVSNTLLFGIVAGFACLISLAPYILTIALYPLNFLAWIVGILLRHVPHLPPTTP